jgi:hypothetical protein
MFEYLVCDYNFSHVGWVKADNAETALIRAKVKYPFAVAPMVFSEYLQVS